VPDWTLTTYFPLKLRKHSSLYKEGVAKDIIFTAKFLLCLKMFCEVLEGNKNLTLEEGAMRELRDIFLAISVLLLLASGLFLWYVFMFVPQIAVRLYEFSGFNPFLIVYAIVIVGIIISVDIILGCQNRIRDTRS
jgi:hypothetical protein